MIRSNVHALEILESSEYSIPYEAIRYLYNQTPTENIRKKVFYWIENAYNYDLFPEEDYGINDTPVWFAILAENYIEERLIDPVIDLFTKVDDDWELMNEQGVILIRKLCEQLGDVAVEKFLNKIVQQINVKSKLPYLYLFDCFRYIDPAKYPEQILALLATKSHWMEALIALLPDMHFSQKKHPELLEKIQKKLALFQLEYERMKTLDHIDKGVLSELKICQTSLSKADYPNTKNSFESRTDWEADYRKFEKRFDDQDLDEEEYSIPSPVSIPKKISRNAPCPCGSGKKYKRCCL